GWWAASVDNNPSGVVHATAFPETQNAHKRRLHVWRRGWDGSAHPCASPLAVLGAAFGVQIRSRRICRTEWVRPHTTLPDTTKGPAGPFLCLAERVGLFGASMRLTPRCARGRLRRPNSFQTNLSNRVGSSTHHTPRHDEGACRPLLVSGGEGGIRTHVTAIP